MIFEEMEFYNVAELIDDGGAGKLLTRIPNDLRLSLNEAAKGHALFPAGSEIRFNLNGATVKIVLNVEGEGWGIAEVFQGPFQVNWHYLDSKPTEIVIVPPANPELLAKAARKSSSSFDPSLTRLILPHLNTIRLVAIEIKNGNITPPSPGQTPSRRYLAYGSSITHGSAALRPTGTYAARTAELLGVDLVNLGFGAGAHCESQIADYIAGRKDWNFASLELGINMVGGFEAEEFRKRVEYLISRIAQAHPDKWLFCMDMFAFSDDVEENVGKSEEFRKIVSAVVKKVNSPKVVHLDGRKILTQFSGLTLDLLHPSSSGMEQMAQNLSRFIAEKLRGGVQKG